MNQSEYAVKSIGFTPDPGEIVVGEIETEFHMKGLALLLIILGAIMLTVNIIAYVGLFGLEFLVTIPIGLVAGILLMVIGALVWSFMRRTGKLFVTSQRIVEEYTNSRLGRMNTRDYHYNFFESIEIIRNPTMDTARMLVHLSSGELIEFVLPTQLIEKTILHSRRLLTTHTE
jgi:hypothetical protein